MTAIALVPDEAQEPEEGRLADEIARAMHDRPLMRRLARVEASFETAEQPSTPAVTAAPPPMPHLEGPALTASIDELIDDAAGSVTTLPPSADWLDNAKRERQRDRLRTLLAWLTTFAIAATIVGAALLMLRA